MSKGLERSIARGGLFDMTIGQKTDTGRTSADNRPIFREDLDPLIAEGCPVEGPNFRRLPHSLHSKCHPYHAILASYADGVIRLRCANCQMTVVDLAIASKQGDTPP